MGDEFAFLKNNTLSRAELSDSEGAVRNIHYGDILTKFGSVLDGAHVGIPRIMNEETAHSLTNDQLRDGDIIVADTAEDEAVGKCTELRELGINKIVSGLHTIPLRPYSRYAPGFLGHYLNSDAYHCQLKPLMQGIKVISISRTALAETQLTVPSFDEQRQIGGYFSNLDALITLHQRERRKAPFSRSFAWEQRKLGNCGTTYGGLTGKTKEDFGHGNARFIPYTNVFDNPLTDTKRLEAVEIDSSQNQVVYGDVFFTVSSETPDEVGMSSVWLSDQEDVYLNSFCFGYRQDSTFDPHYLAYMLRSSSVRSNLTLLAQGISRFNISKNKVMELSVPVPSVVEQKQLGQYFTKLDNLITLHQ